MTTGYGWNCPHPNVIAVLPAPSLGEMYCDNGEMEKEAVLAILDHVNTARQKLANGQQRNAGGDCLPPAFYGLKNLTYNCDLENDYQSEIPENCSNTDNDDGAADAFHQYIDDIDEYPLIVTPFSVEYNDSRIQGYAKFMSEKATTMGCIWFDCPDQYGVGCTTDSTVPQPGDVIYTVAESSIATTTTTTTTTSTPMATTTTTSKCVVTTTPKCVVTTTCRPARNQARAKREAIAGNIQKQTFQIPDSQICPNNKEMTDTLRLLFLDMHNYRRLVLSLGKLKRGGEFLPQAKNMMRLVYDCGLEELAVKYAKRCPLTRSQKPGKGHLGKNYYRLSKVENASLVDAVVTAVDSWWRAGETTHLGPSVLFQKSYLHTPIKSFTQVPLGIRNA
ncbi:unnamed protein product [Cylicocyclus nassatus]|uniref:SCP domain-containing protein n=1 Tax=Cylicocyclus nassatus TaxID=53992 RepID=A0AA36GZM1_CYLNA|nr:unnamed protein product [Cylicocyclus nassatus]